jgi:hypothetical protein
MDTEETSMSNVIEFPTSNRNCFTPAEATAVHDTFADPTAKGLTLFRWYESEEGDVVNIVDLEYFAEFSISKLDGKFQALDELGTCDVEAGPTELRHILTDINRLRAQLYS